MSQRSLNKSEGGPATALKKTIAKGFKFLMQTLFSPPSRNLPAVWQSSCLFKKAALIFAIWLGLGCSHAAADAPDEKPLVIIIPSYNNKDWYRSNLDSVLNQKYENFRVIYFDDASTDKTGDLVREYLLEKDQKNKVTLIQNDKRLGALANIFRGVWLCKPSEIVVTVDGDDWLYHEHVLKIINDAYSDPNVWMTYGQYVSYPAGGGFGAQKIPSWVIEGNSFRSHDWVTTHLRTFYAGLFHKIDVRDLLYTGWFYPVAWDLAFMFPMLEMSGPHSLFISDPLYVYNIATPLSDNKLYLDLQRYLETLIRAKNSYSPIEKPY